MAATAAHPGHGPRSHRGRTDVPALPGAGARRRALVRRRRTVAAVAAAAALAALAWSPSSQALQGHSPDGPSVVRAPTGPDGAAASDRSAGAASATASAGDAPEETSSLRRVVVAEDDTIWSLARAHGPSGTHPSIYAREVMDLNDVDPRRLRAGEVLWLPVR